MQQHSNSIVPLMQMGFQPPQPVSDTPCEACGELALVMLKRYKLIPTKLAMPKPGDQGQISGNAVLDAGFAICFSCGARYRIDTEQQKWVRNDVPETELQDHDSSEIV